MKLQREDLRYIAVPIVGTSTSFGVRTFLAWLLWNGQELSVTQGLILGWVGWAFAVTTTYITSRWFVYKSQEPILAEAILYIRNRFGTMIIESLLVGFLTNRLQNASAASLLSSCCISVLNWVLTRRLMLNKSESGGDKT